MYLAVTYVVILVLTVAIAVIMLWRHRSLPSYIVAAGAAAHVVGLLLQVSVAPIAVPPGEAVVDLGSGWRLGNALTNAGSIVFLLGLLWYVLRRRAAAAVKEVET
jgi:hypothetical protein